MSWAIGMMIPRDFRVHYWNSIKSSYTPGELQAILESSKLQGWRIVEDFMDLMVVKDREPVNGDNGPHGDHQGVPEEAH
jgi:hypothetical protein